MLEIKITDEYTLTGKKNSFTLSLVSRETTIGTMGKAKGKEVREKYDKYYGTFYQALQGFVFDYCGRYSNDVTNIVERVDEALMSIDNACSEIEDEYRIVKVVRG